MWRTYFARVDFKHDCTVVGRAASLHPPRVWRHQCEASGSGDTSVQSLVWRTYFARVKWSSMTAKWWTGQYAKMLPTAWHVCCLDTQCHKVSIALFLAALLIGLHPRCKHSSHETRHKHPSICHIIKTGVERYLCCYLSHLTSRNRLTLSRPVSNRKSFTLLTLGEGPALSAAA